MLFVLMTIATERYGIDSGAVVEIVPAVELIPSHLGLSPVVRGEFNYHGDRVPVIDGGLLMTGKASTHTLSTRIAIMSIIVADKQALFGLLAEEMTETVHVTINNKALLSYDNVNPDKIELLTDKAAERGFRILNPLYLMNMAHGL